MKESLKTEVVENEKDVPLEIEIDDDGIVPSLILFFN